MAPLKPEPQDCNTSLNNIEKIPVHQTTQIAPASLERLQEICEATSKDPTLRLLANIVHEGWLKTIRDSPCSIQSYWYFRDEITCEDGILYNGVKLIIPLSERVSTLKVLNLGHYAVYKMNLRARERTSKSQIIDVTSVQGFQELSRRRHFSMLKHPKPDGNNLV